MPMQDLAENYRISSEANKYQLFRVQHKTSNQCQTQVLHDREIMAMAHEDTDMKFIFIPNKGNKGGGSIYNVDTGKSISGYIANAAEAERFFIRNKLPPETYGFSVVGADKVSVEDQIKQEKTLSDKTKKAETAEAKTQKKPQAQAQVQKDKIPPPPKSKGGIVSPSKPLAPAGGNVFARGLQAIGRHLWRNKGKYSIAAGTGAYALSGDDSEAPPTAAVYNPNLSGENPPSLEEMTGLFGSTREEREDNLNLYLQTLEENPPVPPEQEEFGSQEIMLAIAKALLDGEDDDEYGDIILRAGINLYAGRVGVDERNKQAKVDYENILREGKRERAKERYDGTTTILDDTRQEQIQNLGELRNFGFGDAAFHAGAVQTGSISDQKDAVVARVIQNMSPAEAAQVDNYIKNTFGTIGADDPRYKSLFFQAVANQLHTFTPQTTEHLNFLEQFPHQAPAPVPNLNPVAPAADPTLAGFSPFSP